MRRYFQLNDTFLCLSDTHHKASFSIMSLRFQACRFHRIFLLLKSSNVLIFSGMTYFLLYILIGLALFSFGVSLCFPLDFCAFWVVVLGQTWPSNSVYMLHLHILILHFQRFWTTSFSGRKLSFMFNGVCVVFVCFPKVTDVFWKLYSTSESLKAAEVLLADFSFAEQTKLLQVQKWKNVNLKKH